MQSRGLVFLFENNTLSLMFLVIMKMIETLKCKQIIRMHNGCSHMHIICINVPVLDALFALQHDLLTVNLQEFEFQIEIRVARLSHAHTPPVFNDKLKIIYRIESNMKTNPALKLYGLCINC